jgi:acetylornithine deacetylase/succinyl-diaminopimelate desuccinylase-like protein
VLHHHIDVVYADRRYWTVDPFGGEISDGYLYGRGALDMKSIGIMQLAAVLAIKRARVPLARDLVILGTADEEAGASTAPASSPRSIRTGSPARSTRSASSGASTAGPGGARRWA